MSINSGGVLSEADAMFIEGVRQTCILYNPTTADFRLSYKKEKAWEELAANLGITPTDAKRRWTCLRDRYTRELRQIRTKSNSQKKGECGGSELFKSMDFLRPFVKKRVIHPNPWKAKQSSAKIKLQDDTTIDQSYGESTQDQYDNKLESTGNEDEYNLVACEYPLESYEDYTTTEQQNFTNETHNTQVPGTQQKCLKNDVIPIMLSPLTASGNMMNNTTVQQQQQHQIKVDSKPQETPPQQQETEDDFFCKSVAMYLRKLSRRHKIKAKVEIFQTLEKYIEIEENTAAAATTAADQQYRRDAQRH